MSVLLFIHVSFLQEDEADYYDNRRSQHRFEDDLEAEARAEKRIMNAKKVLFLSLQKFLHMLIFLHLPLMRVIFWNFSRRDLKISLVSLPSPLGSHNHSATHLKLSNQLMLQALVSADLHTTKSLKTL